MARKRPGPNAGACAAALASLVFAACDGGRSDSVVITPATNQPPVCDAGPDRFVPCEGPATTVHLDGTGSFDPDGSPLTFEWSTDCPGGVFDDAGSATPVLSVPTPACTLVCRAFLTVRDGLAEAGDDVEIRVLAPDLPPVCDAGGDRTLTCTGVQTEIHLDGSASYDPEGAPLSFLWTTDCPEGVIVDPTSATPWLRVPTPECALDCRVYLSVGDGAQFSSCEARILVIPAGNPPALLGSSGIGRAPALTPATVVRRSRIHGPRERGGRTASLPEAEERAGGDAERPARASRVSVPGQGAGLDLGPRALALEWACGAALRANRPAAVRVLVRSDDAHPAVYWDGVVRCGETLRIDAARVGELTLRPRLRIEVRRADGARAPLARADGVCVPCVRAGDPLAGLRVTAVFER